MQRLPRGSTPASCRSLGRSPSAPRSRRLYWWPRSGSPIWATNNGGATWVQKATYPSSDTTLAWSPAGDAAYMATLQVKVDNNPDKSKIDTWKVADPVTNDFA